MGWKRAGSGGISYPAGPAETRAIALTGMAPEAAPPASGLRAERKRGVGLERRSAGRPMLLKTLQAPFFEEIGGAAVSGELIVGSTPGGLRRGGRAVPFRMWAPRDAGAATAVAGRP